MFLAFHAALPYDFSHAETGHVVRIFPCQTPGACPAATTFNAPAGASSSGPQDTLCGLLPTGATPCTNTNVDFQFLNGSAPRNSSKGDPYYRFDLSVTRTVPIRERVRIELRADFFNVFNHTNFLGFNGLDTTNLFSVPAIGSADFNANCTSCLNPFSGQFIGASGQSTTCAGRGWPRKKRILSGRVVGNCIETR